MEERKESPLRKFMVSEDTVPLETSNEQIVNSHPYFTERPVDTFLDEDSAININHSEMVSDPEEYE